MYDDTIIQVNLKNLNVSYRGYELLKYFISHIFCDCKTIDLQKERCLYFSNASEVRDALKELTSCGIITNAKYERGNISEIKPNRELINSIFFSPETKVVIKREQVSLEESKESKEIPDEVMAIVKHHNSIEVFKNCSATALVKARVAELMKLYTVEQINEAISFASTQSWVQDKANERWFNLAWLLKKAPDFMAGGKYNKYGNTNNKPVSKSVQIIEDNKEDDTFFL